MQFKVPQDVQREDTIVGPLTLKQLGIVGLGGGLAYLVYTSLAKAYYWQIWLPPTVLVAGITAAFAFAKIHGLTLTQYLVYLMEYTLLPKKRVWIQGAAEAKKPFSEPHVVNTKMRKDPETKEKSLKDIGRLANILDSRGIIKKPQ